MCTCVFLYMRWHMCFLHAVGSSFCLHAVAMENGPGDINTEIVTKMVPVRAVDLSIGAFCTEFRCEQLCDDDIFLGSGSKV